MWQCENADSRRQDYYSFFLFLKKYNTPFTSCSIAEVIAILALGSSNVGPKRIIMSCYMLSTTRGKRQ